MKKITEAELSRRVSSLREKLISEEIRPFGSHDETITRDPGVDPSITLSKMLPALKDVTRLTTHNGQVVAVNSDGLIRGVYDSPGSWKVGQGMPAVLQNVTVPAARSATVTSPVAPPTPIAGTALPPLAPEVNPTDQRLANKTQTTPAADPVNGKTPEQAMLDPRYKTDPAFKAEVDAAAAIGTPPAFSPAASDAAFKQAMANLNSPQSAAKVSTPAAVTVDPLDGPTGQALARMGISKKDRLNQAFVDRILGPGYTAGSAASNLALLKTKPQTTAPATPPQVAPKRPAPAATDEKSQYYLLPNPSIPAAGPAARPLPSRMPAKESVTYADDQTLARIVSLGRR